MPTTKLTRSQIYDEISSTSLLKSYLHLTQSTCPTLIIDVDVNRSSLSSNGTFQRQQFLRKKFSYNCQLAKSLTQYIPSIFMRKQKCHPSQTIVYTATHNTQTLCTWLDIFVNCHEQITAIIRRLNFKPMYPYKSHVHVVKYVWTCCLMLWAKYLYIMSHVPSRKRRVRMNTKHGHNNTILIYINYNTKLAVSLYTVCDCRNASKLIKHEVQPQKREQ